MGANLGQMPAAAAAAAARDSSRRPGYGLDPSVCPMGLMGGDFSFSFFPTRRFFFKITPQKLSKNLFF